MALAVLNLTPGKQLVSEGPVLRASEWTSLQSAQDVLRQAQDSADDVHAAAAEQARAVVHQQALVRERQQQQALLLKALSLQVEFERLQRELRAQFVQAVTASLQSLMAGPLPAAFFEQAVASSRRWVGQDSRIVLQVSRTDEAAARAAVAHDSCPVRVHVDPELAAGQCFLDTDFGRLQASLDSQLDALREALVRWWQPNPGAGVPTPAHAADALAGGQGMATGEGAG